MFDREVVLDVATLARGARHLDTNADKAAPGLDRITAWAGVVTAALVLQGGLPRMARADAAHLVDYAGPLGLPALRLSGHYLPLGTICWALALYYLNAGSLVAVFIPLMALVAYGALGNFAAFLEIVMAVLIDGHRRRIRLLPINLLCFFASLFAISQALLESVMDRLLHRELVWHKTLRYRAAPGSSAATAGTGVRS